MPPDLPATLGSGYAGLGLRKPNRSRSLTHSPAQRLTRSQFAQQVLTFVGLRYTLRPEVSRLFPAAASRNENRRQTILWQSEPNAVNWASWSAAAPPPASTASSRRRP